jgi:hypothetical protein
MPSPLSPTVDVHRSGYDAGSVWGTTRSRRSDRERSRRDDYNANGVGYNCGKCYARANYHHRANWNTGINGNA